MAYITLSLEGEQIACQNLRATIRVGRSPECDLSVHDYLLSRTHCRFQEIDGRWVVIDLASKNGTFVNDQRILRHDLADGDQLSIGNTTILFKEGMAPALRASGKPRIVRPADPFEALSNTICAMEVPQSPMVERISGRPTPRPAPRPPAAYEAEGVGTMVLDMLSDLHDSQIMQAIRPAQRARPRPQVRASDTMTGVVVPLSDTPQATAPTAPKLSAPRPVRAPSAARPAACSALPVATHRRRRWNNATLDLSMAGLLVSLILVVFLATRALFVMT